MGQKSSFSPEICGGQATLWMTNSAGVSRASKTCTIHLRNPSHQFFSFSDELSNEARSLILQCRDEAIGPREHRTSSKPTWKHGHPIGGTLLERAGMTVNCTTQYIKHSRSQNITMSSQRPTAIFGPTAGTGKRDSPGFEQNASLRGTLCTVS